jgi:hypothetical protein
MAIRMQQRKGTAAQWTASNPTLNSGEIGYESDTNKFKIGDGTNLWATLPYFLDEDTIGTSLDGYIPDTLLGVANGVAQLNSSGKLVSDQIPNVDEITQDAINTALVAGIGLDKTYDDNANTITIDIDSTVATLTGTQTLTNKTLTSPVVNTPTGITKSDVGLANVDNTTDANKPVSTATQTALDLKLASATAATTYAPIASPTFTGTVAGVTATHVGLGNVDNTSDANKPVSSAAQTALDAKLASATAATTYETITNVALKAPLASPALTGTPTAPTATAGTNTTQIATTAYVRGEVSALVASAPAALDTLNELATALNNDASFSTTVSTSIGLKAPLESPTFTGTVSGVTKSHVGLGNVDNTADASKPVSTATQTALDLKAPSASPTFTGTITLPQGKLTGGSTTVSANTATTVSTVALADFTTMEYTVSIKQGSKIRSSKVLVQTDGTAVDSVEHSILETGGTIAGVNVTAAVVSTNAVLRVTVTDAVTTNAVVKVVNTII